MADSSQMKFADLVRNYTLTTGIGDLDLGKAVAGFRSITDALQPGDSFYYSVSGILKANESEVGMGTLLPNGKISRQPNGGVFTDFSSGLKSVALVAAAEWFEQIHAAVSDGDKGDIIIAAGQWSLDADAPNIVNKAQHAANRTALAFASTGNPVAYLREVGREGLFVFDPGDLSAQVTADPQQGLYVAPLGNIEDVTGASGAWVRQYSGPPKLTWWGADPAGVTDAGPAIVAAIAAIPAVAIFASPFKQLAINDGEFAVSTEVAISENVEFVGAGGVIRPNFGAAGGKMFNVTANYFRMTGVEIDGGTAQPTNASGNTWLAHINDLGTTAEFVRCRFINCNATDGNIADIGAMNLLVTHPIYIAQAKSVDVIGCLFDTVSGTAVFVNNCDRLMVDGCTLKSVKWYNVNMAKAVFNWTVQNCNFLCNDPDGVYWGGAIQTVNDHGFVRTKNGRIINNWFEGKFSYGGIIRLQSDDTTEVAHNKFGAVDLGAWGAGGTITYIRVLTRSGTGFSPSEPPRNIDIHHNYALAGCAGGTDRRFIYIDNSWNDPSRNPGNNIKVSKNICRSPTTTEYFDTGLGVHGLSAGFENVDAFDNDLEVYTQSGGFGAFSFVGSNSDGLIDVVRLGGNRVADIAAPTASHQTGIYVLANVNNVRSTRPNIVENFFYGMRTASGAGPTLELLDDQHFEGCTTNTVLVQPLSRYGKPLYGSKTYDPPSIAAGASTFTDLTITGVALGDYVKASFSLDPAGLVFRGYVRVANSVRVYLTNLTGSAVNLASGNVSVEVSKKGSS